MLAVLCVACGSGAKDDRKSFTLELSYTIDGNIALFKAYSTLTPVSSDTPNEKTFFISSGALPPGLSIDEGTGVVSGVPTVAGTYNAQISLKVNYYDGTTTVPFHQTVRDLTLQNASASAVGVESWAVGSNFMLQTVTLYGGTEVVQSDSAHGIKVTYQLAPNSKLPDGLVLDANTGLLSGVSSVKVGVYPNIQYQAVVTYQGLSHTYTAPVMTYNVTASAS